MDTVQNRKIGDVSRKNRYLWIEIDLEGRVAVNNLSITDTEIETNSSIDRDLSDC